ncbi:hypothetical protein NLM59_03670 [Weeksellaceae bacterium KMM 9724]|uniref:hypothetical protein n=1 Tax=Profundicola chukchiensis TaxID=2961959 RepID=UPI00243D43A9|nr:hypothetical protein [Profundicola chukchiensis]MDG4950013.1 hypothetical protein [Profundicola chukchiensis]
MKRLFTPLFLGGGFYTPGDNGPPGPGSPGGTYSGPSESDGSSVGYTRFVIGDGGTGNQDDVDAINQITLEMDAAFGVGNWVLLKVCPMTRPALIVQLNIITF